MLGYHPQVILAGRRINDNMGQFVGEQTIKQLIAHDFPIKAAEIIVLGMTFKENCPDLRNSKVIDVVRELQNYGCQAHIHDPIADRKMPPRVRNWLKQMGRAAEGQRGRRRGAHKFDGEVGLPKIIEKLMPVASSLTSRALMIRPPFLPQVRGCGAYESSLFLSQFLRSRISKSVQPGCGRELISPNQ